MRADHVERIPAHVRNFQLRIARCDAVDFAGNPAEPVGHFVLAAAFGQQLHADADAEKRSAFLPHRLLQRLRHAGDGIEAMTAIRKGADARQNHTVGLGHDGRVVGHPDRFAATELACGALECLGGRVQIAGAVVDDGDAHRPAPGSGNSPMTLGVWATRGTPTDAPLGGLGVVALAALLPDAASRSQASKKRRSASSSLSPLTMPTFDQPHRRNASRRSVLASRPTRTEINRPTMAIAVRDAPNLTSAASMPPDTTT